MLYNITCPGKLTIAKQTENSHSVAIKRKYGEGLEITYKEGPNKKELQRYHTGTV